ncbi:MAG TPA: COR domain-containing protein [Pseudonocardiaceae bacterium]|nr:COR domain-containing protein [Pseudonocardiaceae bacterium]
MTELNVDNNDVAELLDNFPGLTRLSVRNNDLTALPDWLRDRTPVTGLWLSGNALGGLPEWLSGLVNLTRLECDNIGLTELPDWLAELPALSELSVAANPLESVDIDFGHLTRLDFLDLSNCGLAELPDGIGRIPALRALLASENVLSTLPNWLSGAVHLKQLGMTANYLTALPDVTRLTGLVWLYGADNVITELPRSIGALAELQTLYLGENSLSELPAELGQLTSLRNLSLTQNELATLPGTIGGLTALTTLELAGNELTALPAGINGLTRLTTLQLANNRISRLPDSLVELPSLTDLVVGGNPLVSPPPEITAGGSAQVVDFIRERIRVGSTAQWLSKLLVVGEGGVGKTSLVKALAADEHDPDEPSTHGLMIRDVRIDHPSRPDVRMRLSTWDFGGQQIYHATHQFFLTNRSLFVLLWNSRLGWEQGKLHYWLDIISARAPESPIVLVATHIHDRPVDLPLAELRAKYPMIVASVQVDNASRAGVADLRGLLAEEASRLPLMGSEWPTSWLTAADALRKLPENHITPARMWEVMAGAGVTNPRHQSFIARALHELGDILYYVDDPELNQIVVLRPAWVNDYISRVLDSDEVAQRRGLLTREHLNALWGDLDRGVRDHFLGMMDKYDLSYRIDPFRSGDLSLVVERLQWDPPQFSADWDAVRQQPNAREIKVIYRLNTMPPGIPTWFIARSHRFSKNVHWRTGALLGHGDGQHLALISADRQRSTVELAVRGPSPVGFFMVLDDGLNLTLERFPGLHINRQVPCSCGEDCPELFDYDNLQARLARTPPRYEIECHRSGELVSVVELLLGLTPSERDTTRTSIEQLTRTLEQFGDRLNEHSDYSQRMFLRLQRLAQQQQEARCPSVFAVVPADRRSLTGSAFEIHLYCEEPGAWHRLPDARGVYPVTQPKEWFVKLGPYLQHLIRVLKHAAPLAGPVLGVAVGVLDDQLKADCELMAELAEQLPKDVRRDRELPGSPSSGPEVHASTDADFRMLKAMLARLDPTEGWGGLSRFDTPEGLTLYLCDEHLAQYRGTASVPA